MAGKKFFFLVAMIILSVITACGNSFGIQGVGLEEMMVTEGGEKSIDRSRVIEEVSLDQELATGLVLTHFCVTEGKFGDRRLYFEITNQADDDLLINLSDFRFNEIRVGWTENSGAYDAMTGEKLFGAPSVPSKERRVVFYKLDDYFPSDVFNKLGIDRLDSVVFEAFVSDEDRQYIAYPLIDLVLHDPPSRYRLEGGPVYQEEGLSIHYIGYSDIADQPDLGPDEPELVFLVERAGDEGVILGFYPESIRLNGKAVRYYSGQSIRFLTYDKQLFRIGLVESLGELLPRERDIKEIELTFYLMDINQTLLRDIPIHIQLM